MNNQQLSLFKEINYLDKQNNDLTHLTFQKIDLDKGDVTLYPNFFDIQTSNLLLEKLTKQIQWQQDYISFYGKKIPLPRLTAWYGEEGKSYVYSGIKINPNTARLVSKCLWLKGSNK